MVLLDSQDKIVHVDKSAFLVLEIFYPQFATVAPGRGDGISPSMQLFALRTWEIWHIQGNNWWLECSSKLYFAADRNLLHNKLYF